MPVQVNHLQFYGVSYMPPKCQTGDGAFTYYQPHTHPEINTERADFMSFLWPSSPHQLLSAARPQLPRLPTDGQPAEPATVQQLCNSSEVSHGKPTASQDHSYSLFPAFTAQSQHTQTPFSFLKDRQNISKALISPLTNERDCVSTAI